MKLALVAALCLVPAAAFAQSSSTGNSAGTGTSAATSSGTSSGTSSSMSSNQGASQTPLQAKVKKNLQQAGFTDISIVPEGFIVNAKDKDGTPVTMLINPHSVAEIVGTGAGGNSAKSSAGSGSGATANSH